MRILTATRSTPWHPGAGGMERVSWDLMESWAGEGHEVTCLTTPWPGKAGAGGVEVVQLPGPPGRYSRDWFRSTTAYARQTRFDLILGVSAGAHALAGQPHIAAPVVMQAHGTAADEILTRIGQRSPRGLIRAGIMLPGLTRDLRLYRRYDAVVAIGPAVARSLSRYPRSAQPRRVELIPNGVSAEPEARTPARVPRSVDDQVACFVGRLHREKGVDLLLPAVERWGGRLVVVGDGPMRSALEQAAVRRGIAGKVTFTGQVGAETVAGMMARADVVLAPSRRREGLPLVALEALAAGKPVVTSRQVAESFGARAPHGVLAADATAEAVARALALAGTVASSAQITLPQQHRLAEASRCYLDLFRQLQSEKRSEGSHGA